MDTLPDSIKQAVLALKPDPHAQTISHGERANNPLRYERGNFSAEVGMAARASAYDFLHHRFDGQQVRTEMMPRVTLALRFGRAR